MKDLFDTITVPDLIDQVKLDIFDEVELETEDKVLYSKDFTKILREELQKELSSLPLAKMISDALAKFSLEQEKSFLEVNRTIEKLAGETKKEIATLREDLEEFKKKISKRCDELKNEMNQPMYQFGGFSPQVNDLVIGLPSEDGSWRIVKSGNDLVVETNVSGTWTETGRFVRP